MTFSQWVVNLYTYKPNNNDQRMGQWAFNHLYAWKPELANRIRGTDVDPFYIDGRLAKFFEVVEQEWDK